MTREPRLGSVPDLARTLARAHAQTGSSRVIFFIGAGCSVSAGIPLAADVARGQTIVLASIYLKQTFTDAELAYRALVAAGHFTSAAGADAPIDWGHVYNHIFEDHLRDPGEVRRLFRALVEQAEGRINWAHLCLGELARTGHVASVISTNFDQLALRGMVGAGVIPAVCDGVESLNRIDTQQGHPQLIEIHGSRHTYLLRNAGSDVSGVKDDPRAAPVRGLISDSAAFVVIGYAGREDGVMDLLVSAGSQYPDKSIFWVARDANPARLSDKARAFLATSRNARLIVDQDADHFFLELCRELRVGAPRAVREPLALSRELLDRIATDDSTDRAIRDTVAQAQDDLRQTEAWVQERIDARPAMIARLDEARQAMLAGDHRRAYQNLAGWVEGTEDPDAWEALADAAAAFGRDHPETDVLDSAVRAFRRLLELRTDASLPVRTEIELRLGDALSTLGQRQPDVANLEAAAGIYRDVIVRLNRK